MTDLKGRWVFITGAARGIGYLSAVYMAKQGCNLILHSRSIDHTKDVIKEVETLGVKAHAVSADLNDLSAVRRMLDDIDALGVDVDVVLNNAGLQVAYRNDYISTPAEDYLVSFNVNTIAPMMICYHFMPKMTERGFGRIVNTTSGIRLEPEQAGYSASKAALDKVTTDLGKTVNGTDVMINLTDPGWCRTDLGGPNAPNAPESSIPGVVLGAFINDKKSGRIFAAQDYKDLTLEEAIKKAETECNAPY